MGDVRAFSTRKRWTAEDEHLLRENYASSSREELSRLFPERKIRSIECKAHLMGLRKPARIGRSADDVREAKRLHMAARRQSDPDAARAYGKEYYRLNREKRRAAIKTYQARRFFWMRSIKLQGVSERDLAQLWKSQRGLCGISGRRLSRQNAQIDHIIPKSRGGDDRLSNLRWACAEANLAKRDMTDIELFDLCADILDRVRISMERTYR